MSIQEADPYVEFLTVYCEDELAELCQQWPDKRSLWIDYADLYQFDSDLAEELRAAPEREQDNWSKALADVDVPVDVPLDEATVRVHNLDPHTRKLEKVRGEDVGELIALSGQISKVSAVRPLVKDAAYECKRCGAVTTVPVSGELTPPHECKGCQRQGPFELDYHKSDVVDHQLVRIKQPPEDASTSTQIGNEIDAHVEGDLVGLPDAGERADIPGILEAIPNDKNPTLDFEFDAWAIDKRGEGYHDLDIGAHREEIERIVTDDNPFEALAGSIAPGITGGRDVDIETPWGETHDKYWWVRLAVGVANLFGGWRRARGDGTYHRGSSHTLLMGDPSTGKSTIMQAVEKISPRSAAESGKNASGVGLTAAAVRDDFGDSQWSLEAGALVKAHNGVACIDEIDKMDKDGLSRLHSALEKQRLEINKAGIDATLKCETSMLAAGNPKDSRFSKYETDTEQIDIVSSLLDRFDLVFTFKDVPQRDRDESIAESVIESRIESGLVATNQLDEGERSTASPAVPPETLRAWVAHARQSVRPVIEDDAVTERLREFYVDIRMANDGEDEAAVPATVRTLDGLLRLSEAFARVRLSDTVEMADVELAIAVLSVSLNDVGYDPETGDLDADYRSGRTSWSQQDRINKVKGIIDNLSSHDTGAGRDNVIETAVSAGMDEDKAGATIDLLKKKGEITEPSTNHYRKI